METSRYDEKLTAILRVASEVMAAKGYRGASIRDISSATGVSLSGLYYYFRSKEELLFLIQEHCFRMLLDQLQHELRGVSEPQEKLGRFIRLHVDFFTQSMPEMKVLSHEADSLTGEYRSRIMELKRAYTEELARILDELVPVGAGPAPSRRVLTFALFGMLNWLYTWYRPDRDPPPEELARQLTQLFLDGCLTQPSLVAPAPVDGSQPRTFF